MPRESLIQNVHYFHLGKNTCNEGKGIKTYLMLIRNPLTRIQSWFNFEKNILPSRKNKQAEIRLRWKRGMIFNECYNTFADLVINGIGTIHRNRDSYKILSGRSINMTCPERALAALCKLYMMILFIFDFLFFISILTRIDSCSRRTGIFLSRVV